MLHGPGMKIPVHVRDDSRGSVQVFCPDLPGCSATGTDVDSALAILRSRIEAYFAPSRRAPSGTRVVTLEV